MAREETHTMRTYGRKNFSSSEVSNFEMQGTAFSCELRGIYWYMKVKYLMQISGLIIALDSIPVQYAYNF